MSGKAYTMKEMKIIVDYLSENKFYGELKGRKMWMDFANTRLTNRTWQSLKETFLKRILPDIHNPYYKLTREQIISFTEGCDIQAKEKNKLEIVTVSDDSNGNAQTTRDNDQSSTSNNDDGAKTKGEDTKSSKISSRNRSSADTVVLENCYETAEEIQRELESPKPNSETKSRAGPNKTIRDYITYSEPLTPMLQEVLHDFASESEGSDKEPQMKIVENPPDMDNQDSNDQRAKAPTENKKSDNVTTDVGKNAKGLSPEVVEEVLLSETQDNRCQPGKNKTLKDNEQQNNLMENKSEEKNAETISIHSDKSLSGVDDNDLSKVGTESKAPDAENHVITEDAQNMNKENTNTHNTNEKISQNCSNNTTDTILPNNQEGLEGAPIQTQKEINTQDVISIESEQKASRKRASPLDNQGVENKKKKEDKILSDTEKDNNSVMPVTNDKSKENQKTLEEKSHIEEIANTNNVEKSQERPTTSKQTEVHDKIITSPNGSDKEKSPQPHNPCLKSVSLFAEQFNDTKYSDSETSDILIGTTKETESKDENINTSNEVVKENVVLLKSHSESESNHEKHAKESKIVSQVSKRQRDKALANVFGFSSGGVPSNRKTRLSLKRSNSQRRIIDNMGPLSSEWTSESDSEVYVSPPRGRKNRQTKKFLKPNSARILSLEEDGGLFVMYGKRIYPLVKDGKIVKNYLTYSPNTDSDIEDETYWKIKYEEEKKKSEELKKLLEAKEPISRERASPILPTNSHRTTSMRNQRQSTLNLDKSTAKVVNTTECEDKKEIREERIKIKFTRNNEEVHLEGHWPQIHPVLEQVVNIFHKEVDAQTNDSRPKMLMDASEQSKEISSGKSTPIIPNLVDPETQEKVKKIETEIFKEIENIDKEEQSKIVVQETNVTKRKPGRPRISSTSSASKHSPAKRTRRSKNDELPVVDSDNKARVSETVLENKDTNVPTLRSRTPRKILNEAANTTDPKPTRSRKSKQNQQEVNTIKEAEDDDGIRYMFPPNKKKSINKSASVSNNSKKQQNSKSSKYAGMSSPENLSRISESTQGYQDSDVSPMKLKKKRKLSLSTIQHRGRKQYNQRNRRKSYPYYIYGLSPDSSNSSDTIRNETSQNTQNSSEAYKSDSYRFLCPKQKNGIGCLERIDETSPNNNFPSGIRHFDGVTTKDDYKANNRNSSKANTDVGSSSNVSLPLSPELSVVENISISKELIGCVEDCPIVNETQVDDAIVSPIYKGNKYTISDIDVSIPLMEQMCEFHKSKEKRLTISNSDNKRQNRPSISESLLNKICAVNIDDNCTMSDSLDRKLQQLLLESAKKMTIVSTDNQTRQDMDIDERLDTAKKAKAKKRCSTPRKKKVVKKSEVPKVDAVVEECMEFCFYGGRKSCPPSIQMFDDNAMGLDGNIPIHNNNIEDATKLKANKAKKKKDIIKVKIIRPRDKSRSNEKLNKPKNGSKVSVCTDSGINDTESEAFLPVFNDSVDLIHNHSETCLHANECIDNSVEFIETSNTVISLNSNSIPTGLWQGGCDQFQDAEFILPNVLPVHLQVSPNHIESTGETVYHSPANSDLLNASLITEDLSDVPTQPQSQSNPSKWYLFDENESTNSNVDSGGGFGANLNQLFPITCAVPDLSTITEMSRENEDSRKPNLDQDIGSRDYDSECVFNI